MKRTRRLALLAAAPLLLVALPGTAPAAEPWRSDLYPANWTPSYRQDPSDPGKFLHDFSYAGYHEGRDPIPADPGWAATTYNVRTQFGAKGDGVADDTGAVQAALDAAAANGGGTVYLPPGTYKVAPKGSNQYSLWLKSARTVLKGAGSGQTKLYNAAPVMRDEGRDFGKNVIRVSGSPTEGAWDSGWYGAGSNTRKVTATLDHQATKIPVSSTSGLSVGEWIVVRSDANDAFVADHDMTGYWDKAELGGKNVVGGPVFYRKITAIDGDTLTVDVPLRYRMLEDWNPRVYQVPSHIGEVGVQGISIGMRQNTTPGTGPDDYAVPGTGAYQLHDSAALSFEGVVQGWVKDVKTFRPQGNTDNVHVLSKGIEFKETRSVTVQDVYMARPQYLGSGGNGYMVQFANSQENLLTSSTLDHGNVNVSFSRMGASGNVVHDNTLRYSHSDFHRYLSYSNLFDSNTLDGECLDGVNRGHASLESGHTTSQSVFWNTTGGRPCAESDYLIETAQHGYGYAVGTRSTGTGFHQVATTATRYTRTDPLPTDVVQGVGRGAALQPQSLYEDQRARRLG